MKPDYYFNIRVVTAITRKMGPSGSSIDVLAMAFKAVHGIATQKGFRFAAAFPEARTGTMAHPGTALRVFVEDREHADEICDQIERSTRLSGYVDVGRVRRTPQDVRDVVEYRLHRQWRRSDTTPEARAQILAKGDLLPYLRTTSKSEGAAYSIRFDVIRTKEGKASEVVEPNGYGLSVPSRPFQLPDFELEAPPWIRVRDGQ